MGIREELADLALAITNPRAYREKMAGMRAHYGALRDRQVEEERIAGYEPEISDDELVRREKAAGHRGGWLNAVHGDIEGHPVTMAVGWGTKEGECLLADGHVDTRRGSDFYQWKHDHFGPGNGPNNNGTRRDHYTGPGFDM